MQKRTILLDILHISPFPGWHLDYIFPYLNHKISRLELDLLFPYRAESLISEYYLYLADLLREKAKDLPIELGVTGKIRWMIHTHFQHILANKEAERSAIAEIFNPAIALQSPVYVAELMDVIWRAAGDESSDMNYYSKRISLGTIYVATLLYWFQTNATLDEIMAFFDARVENLKSLTTCTKTYTPSSENALKNFRLLKTMFWDPQ
jgi:ubiquinone biosynthesis protein COQ9